MKTIFWQRIFQFVHLWNKKSISINSFVEIYNLFYNMSTKIIKILITFMVTESMYTCMMYTFQDKNDTPRNDEVKEETTERAKVFSHRYLERAVIIGSTQA